MRYFEVAPTKLIRAESATFTYHTPDSTIAIGSLVLIPVGKKEIVGVVVEKSNKPTYPTRAILHSLPYPALPAELVKTALWMSEYYATHLAIVLQTVLPRGLTKTRRTSKEASLFSHRKRTNFLLNNAQVAAVHQLLSMTSGGALLHGITGSGKTAVYIELAKHTIASGKSVIVLVPEIALTSQLVAEFHNHFAHVILTHSRQTEAERHRAWERVLRATEPQIIIGPRSALFMPAASIGYIIIDEAHEPSFKQDQSPRYHAQRVASVLAAQHIARTVQGSATPLVTEYYLAKAANRPIITLPERARNDAAAPTIQLVDMTQKTNFTRHRFLSDALLASIDTTLGNKQQVLIFHNRRGSATTTLCEACGWSAVCPRCFIPYTLHADHHRLECHVCANKSAVPTSCPECHSTDIIHKGIGTKLLETELRKRFPKASIERFDGDSTSEATLDQRYQQLYDGTIDIIIGTQVVAKGLDLPHLGLVGVVQADAGLSLPDFTASERTFQLLSQVVGRVGRSHRKTNVIVQSFQPSALPVQTGLHQDYTTFYDAILEERRRGHFPPFTFLLKLTCVYKTEAAAIRQARALASSLRATYPSLTIFGPVPAFYERQHNTYRWQIIVKSSQRATLIDVLKHVPSAHWQSDLDASSLL